MRKNILHAHGFYLCGLTLTLAVGRVSAQPRELTILHTNDMHAGFVPHEAFWVHSDPKPLVGGFNELAAAVDSLRHVRRVTLLLDAGDVMTGNPITEYVYGGAEGGALFEMMNRIGYDAWTPGNHDFDISQANLVLRTRIARFPTVSANIRDEKNGFPVNNREYTIVQKDGLRIGIVGLMSDDFYQLINQNSTVGIKLLPAIETTQQIVDRLAPETDLIVALTHKGVQEDSVLAANTKGLHVIVGGHSHTRLREPKVVNGVVIVQTGSNCENLGILDLTVDSHSVTKHHGVLLPLWYNSRRPPTVVSSLVDSMKKQIDDDYSRVIGSLKHDWIRNDLGESGIGNFVADAQREAAHADVGFMNNLGIRKNLSAGPITKRDVFEILPFRNMLTTFPLTGRQLRGIVLYYLDGHPWIQFSGLHCQWKRDKSGKAQMIRMEVNGSLVDDNREYVAAASDYFVGESKRYLGLPIERKTYLQQTVFAAIQQKIIADRVIDTQVENRLLEVH